MTVLAYPVPTTEQIPFLASLGLDPAPRMKVGSVRWQQLTSAEKLLLAESEDDLTRWVLDYAAPRGWKCWHDADSRRNRAGLPDWIFIRERVVWAELKNETYKATSAQVEFARALRAAGQQVHLWRPRHKAAVLEVLR